MECQWIDCPRMDAEWQAGIAFVDTGQITQRREGWTNIVLCDEHHQRAEGRLDLFAELMSAILAKMPTPVGKWSARLVFNQSYYDPAELPK